MRIDDAPDSIYPTDQAAPGLLQMRRGEHICIAGITGSGKSVLVREMLRRLRAWSPTTAQIIIDPKWDFKIAADKVIRKLSQLRSVNPARDRIVLVRLGPEESEIEHYDAVFRWVYERGRKSPQSSQRVHIDDLSVVATAAQHGPYLRALYQQGRGLGIGVSSNMQRVFTVPRFAQSEATGGFYKFKLATLDDAGRMGEYMGRTVLEPKTYPLETIHSGPHTFWYYRFGMVAPVERVLRLGDR